MDAVEIFDHLFWFGERHQLLAGAHVREEGLEVALKSDAFLDLLHFGQQPPHLPLPELKHFLGGLVRGREILNLQFVILLAARNGGDAGRVTPRRQILARDEIMEILECGNNLCLHHVGVGRGQPLSIRRGKTGGHLFDRRVEHVILNRELRQVRHLGNDLFDERLGQHIALGHARAHVGHRRRTPTREGVHPFQPVVIVTDGLERLGGGAAGELGDDQMKRPTELIHRQQVRGKLELFQIHLALPLQHVLAYLLLLGEFLAVESAQSLKVTLIEDGHLGAVRIGQHVRQEIVVAVVTSVGCLHRIQLEALLIVAIE